jgi:DNA-binding NarL/FixJ family response regulator
LSAGRPAPALSFCKLADALLASLGARRSPADDQRSQALQERIRAALGPADSAALGPAAGDLDLDKAVEHAVALLTSLPAPPTARRPLADPDVIPLSPREREVATLIARGLTNRQIAERLVISLRTADAHVAHILAKLGFAARAQIAVWATGRANRQMAVPAVDRHEAGRRFG